MEGALEEEHREQKCHEHVHCEMERNSDDKRPAWHLNEGKPGGREMAHFMFPSKAAIDFPLADERFHHIILLDRCSQ